MDEYKKLQDKILTRDSLTDEQFNTIMETGYQQAKDGETVPVEDVFAEIFEIGERRAARC